MPINHTKYDRDDWSLNYPEVSEDEECHVEKQFRESFWFNLFGIVFAGGFIGCIVYGFFFM